MRTSMLPVGQFVETCATSCGGIGAPVPPNIPPPPPPGARRRGIAPAGAAASAAGPAGPPPPPPPRRAGHRPALPRPPVRAPCRCARIRSRRCLPSGSRRRPASRPSTAAAEYRARWRRRGRGRLPSGRRTSARHRRDRAGRNVRARSTRPPEPTNSLPPPWIMSMPMLIEEGPVTFLARPTRML